MINEIAKKILSKVPKKKLQLVNNTYGITHMLSEYMKEQKINKSALAKKLNKKNSVISKWFSGEHNFTLDTLSEIESELGITLFVFNIVEKFDNPVLKTSQSNGIIKKEEIGSALIDEWLKPEHSYSTAYIESEMVKIMDETYV